LPASWHKPQAVAQWVMGKRPWPKQARACYARAIRKSGRLSPPRPRCGASTATPSLRANRRPLRPSGRRVAPSG
jgi:hypothetical protein